MKIAFVIPGDPSFGQQQYPLGIAYLAALAEGIGHECKIFDEIAGDDIQEEFRSYRPDIACFTGTTMFISNVYEHTAFVRKELPGTKIILGGPHVSAMPDEAIKYADIVFRNESEGNFLQAIEGKLPNGVHEGEYVKDLDSLPFPAYRLLKLDHYLAQKDRIVGFDKKVASIITSRGCPWKCTFCYNSFRENPVRFHSADRVIKEIGLLQKEFSIEGLYFCDDEFMLKPKRLAEICDYLKKEKLVWECQAQVRSVLRHPEVIKIVKDAGCVLLAVGFESGSERVLNDLKQGASTVAMNQEVIDLCKSEGMPVHGTFMIGNPGETIDDIRMTEKFINKNRGTLKYVSVLKTTPFPGTQIWHQCVENGVLKPPFNWREFDCGPDAPRANEFLSNEEIVREVKRINMVQTLKNYSLLQIIKRVWRYRRFLMNYLPSFRSKA